MVETFAAGAPAQAIAGVNGCLSRMPPEQAAQLCPAWEIKWVLDSVGRMHASYVQYTGALLGCGARRAAAAEPADSSEGQRRSGVPRRVLPA